MSCLWRRYRMSYWSI